MSSMALEPLLHHTLRQSSPKIHPVKHRKSVPFSVNFNSRPVKIGGSLSLSRFKPHKSLSVIACSATTTLPETSESTDVIYSETFQLTRVEKVRFWWYLSDPLCCVPSPFWFLCNGFCPIYVMLPWSGLVKCETACFSSNGLFGFWSYCCCWDWFVV